MVHFNYQLDFQLPNENNFRKWIQKCIEKYHFKTGQIHYIFCNDAQLLNYNQKFLNHDTFTDIMTFDYTKNKKISGDIFISLERVRENAQKFEVDFEEELKRVMIHGILHCIGFKDTTQKEKAQMRLQENTCIKWF